MHTITIDKGVRALSQSALAAALLLWFSTLSACAEPGATKKSSRADIVHRAAAEGKLAFKLTTPRELKALLGPAATETTKSDGGMEVLDLEYAGVAIIDQPLLKDHIEYADRIVQYETIDVQGVPVQMHGPPVASIAVGKTCGVAPEASLHYFAVPMWKPDNQPYCDIIDELIRVNKDPNTSEQVRVVSISTGMFPQQANFDRWKEALKKAEQHGILAVTCAQDTFSYGMLARTSGKDPDDPAGYHTGLYGVRPGAVLVPASNRTTAGHRGRDVYTYWREAGMSWATPYLAGLAALAYQVNPEVEPKTIIRLWRQTAVQTDVGLVINPLGFVEAVRKLHAAESKQH
jgi:subtilisin family serine protease